MIQFIDFHWFWLDMKEALSINLYLLLFPAVWQINKQM